MSTDGAGNVAKTLQDGRLELVTKGSALNDIRLASNFFYVYENCKRGMSTYPQVVEEIVHEVITEGLALLTQRSGDVTNKTNGH